MTTRLASWISPRETGAKRAESLETDDRLIEVNSFSKLGEAAWVAALASSRWLKAARQRRLIGRVASPLRAPDTRWCR